MMVRETVVGGKVLTGKTRQEAFDDCHVFRHWWKPTVVDVEGGVYVQHLICMRCGGERRWKVNRITGHPDGNSYSMADGYYYVREDDDEEDATTRNGRLRIQEIERNLEERAAKVTQLARRSQSSGGGAARAAGGRRR